MRKETLAPAAVVFGVLLLWETVVRLSWLDALFFPAPTTLAVTFFAMLRTGELRGYVGQTLLRTAIGFVLGSTAGIAAGAVMGLSTWIRRIIEPFAASVNATPKLTLLPMVMLLAGSNESARQILLAV